AAVLWLTPPSPNLWIGGPDPSVPNRDGDFLPRAHWPYFTSYLAFWVKNRCMDVIAAARMHNQRAVQQKWNHFCDPTLAFSLPRYSQLLDIWNTKAGSRKMPRRSDLTARDLKDFLRDIVLFRRESSNPSRYVWRLVGTGLTDV